MKKLITPSTIGLVSTPIEIMRQMTFVALGLEATDYVTFWLVLLTDPLKGACGDCPPLAPVLPTILGEEQMKCCGAEIRLTPDNPVVILDYPQGFLVRLKLHITGDPTTQTVMMQEDTTTFLTDRLRGCACP